MKKRRQAKQGGTIRRNRRVRPKVTLGQRWQNYAPSLKRAQLGISKILLIIGNLAASAAASIGDRVQPAARLRTFFIAVGKNFRKRSWPLFEKMVIFCTKKLKRMVRQKNRRAVTRGLMRFGHFILRQMIQTPYRIHQLALILAGKKGPRLKFIRNYFDPSAVRTENEESFSTHTCVITGSFAGALVCAALLICGAAGLFSNTTEDNDAMAESSPAVSDSPNSSDSAEQSASAPSTDGTADFYNPFYVFTSKEAAKVSAYPLADPPGIVVDVHGIKEADAPPEEMIGRDERVLNVRRLVTSKGLRYIIRTSQSMKRIKSQAEGNVITVSPIS